MVDFDDYVFEDVTKKMLLNAQPFIANDDSDDKSTLLRKAFVIDTAEWYDKENPRKHQKDDKGFIILA